MVVFVAPEPIRVAAMPAGTAPQASLQLAAGSVPQASQLGLQRSRGGDGSCPLLSGAGQRHRRDLRYGHTPP